MDKISVDVVVVGAGPGGYAAAFYAASKGKKVVMIEKDKNLGGVCLNRGCIPSKALLHATALMNETKHAAEWGIEYKAPKVNLDKMRDWKNGIINKLSEGIRGLGKRREVEIIHGRGHFEGGDVLRVETEDGQKFIEYGKAIIAVGSSPAVPAAFDLGNPRVMTSTGALQLEDIPKTLLVVGGGYIGMELGTVYAELGSEVTVVEALDSILAGADSDLARPVRDYAEKNFKEVRTSAKVTSMATKGKQIKVGMEYDGQKLDEAYDRVLVSVGRKPNTEDLGLKSTDIELDPKGFIKVNESKQTADPNIYAIGDVAGGLMLAHKASQEARVAVDAICGEMGFNEDVVIPAVVFTNPEVAWCGLTENEARQQEIAVDVVKFPWGASGRAMTLDRTDGLTKLIIEKGTERILGVGMVGVGAGDMISEGILAVEMGATVGDLAECVHPHPTLSETVMEAAEMFYGHSAHAYSRPRQTV